MPKKIEDPFINPSFSLSQYDSEGDVVEKGIFIYFKKTSVFFGNTIDEYDEIVENLSRYAEKTMHPERSGSFTIQIDKRVTIEIAKTYDDAMQFIENLRDIRKEISAHHYDHT